MRGYVGLLAVLLVFTEAFCGVSSIDGYITAGLKGGNVLSSAGTDEVVQADFEKYLVRPDANYVISTDANSSIDNICRQMNSDPRTFIKRAIAKYNKDVNDYTGVVHKQERIRDKLGKSQLIEFKLRQEPFSVFMKWRENPTDVDKLLYVTGKNKGKMRVHPRALFGLIRAVNIKPQSKKALKNNLYPCTDFGLIKLLEKLLASYEESLKTGGVKTIELGVTLVDDRPCAAFGIVVGPGRSFGIRQILVEVDAEYLLPVGLVTFDEDGELVGRYVFEKLQFNVELSDADFTRKAAGL